jgi:alkanesulfonate monooxygenase SsuD/methylene tetrahydromethanopterin reductase-like flavin-dependent oxidoreductase (luciferase family)
VKIDFSVGFGRHMSIKKVAEHARAAEANGFKQMTNIDSQNLSRDVYSMMTIAALNTERILIGPAVTNPFTRHWTVTANAIATINELSDGRAFLGIGSGVSSVWTMGVKTRPLRETRAMIEFIRQYMTGQDADWQGNPVHSEWVRTPVPIYIGSGGPKSLLQAGEIADGVICTCVHPDVVRWRVNRIREGALAAGRDPGSIDIWARTIVYVTDGRREDALAEVGHYATQRGYQILNEPQFADVARELEEAEPGITAEFKAVADAYLPYQHEAHNAPHGRFATQRVVDFFHLVGTSDHIAERIHELADCGVTNISCVLYTLNDKIAMMNTIGDRLIPKFQAR